MIEPIDGTLIRTTNLDLSEPGSNGSEGVLHIFQNSRTGATLSESDVV